MFTGPWSFLSKNRSAQGEQLLSLLNHVLHLLIITYVALQKILKPISVTLISYEKEYLGAII